MSTRDSGSEKARLAASLLMEEITREDSRRRRRGAWRLMKT